MSSRASRLTLVGLIALAMSGMAANAALLNPAITNPIITYNSTGTIAFDPGTQLFAMHADPIVMLFPDNSSALVNPPEDVRIRVLIDGAGNASSNGTVDDFVVEGQIDTNGDLTYEYSGTLLTGKLVAFGHLNVGTTDRFDFIFEVTGGQLAPLWAGGRIGVLVTSERSTFTGSFTTAFSGGAKGNIGYLPCEKQAISGSVLCTRDNTPVVGASITVKDSNGNTVGSTSTGNDGSYSVPNLTAPATYTVSVGNIPADTRNCTPDSVSVNLPCTQGATQNFCVCPCLPSAIKGKVLCSTDGSPVEGATINVYDSTDTQVGTAQSGPDGSYTVPALVSGSYTVSVVAPNGYKVCSPDDIPVTLVCEEDATLDLCVCKCEASRITGKALCDRDGSPIANVSISVYDGLNQLVGSATTANDGSYTVPNLPIGTYNVVAIAPTGAKLCGVGSIQVQLGCEEDGAADFCVCPCLPSNITGKVICDRDNAPIANATVIAVDSSNNPAGSANTLADGTYTISGLAIGKYTVSVAPPAGYKRCDTGSVEVELVCEEDGIANFCVCPCTPSNITGKVTCPADNSAVENATVTAYDSANAVVGSATTAADGTYTISGLAPGGYSVKISPLDGKKLCGPDTVPVTLVCEQDGTADFCMCPCTPSKITGKVTCPTNGTNIENVKVDAYDSTNALVGSANTLADGSYEIAGLKPGSYTITITPIANTEACGPVSKVVVLVCEQDGTADFCLCPCTPSRITGKVTCPRDNSAMASVLVTAYDSTNTAAGSDTTDVDGNYVIEGLAAGVYTVQITPAPNTEACGSTSASVTLECSKDGTADFCLCPCIPSKITGIVTCPRDNSVIKDVTVTVYDSTNAIAGSATTQVDGTYTVNGLAAGVYTVKITPPENTRLCGSDTASVTLECSRNGTANFCLCPCVGSKITGKVVCTESGSPVAQANITVTVYDENNAVAGSAMTAANGTYSVPNLPPGDYTVVVTLPPKYQSCDDTTKTVTLVCEQDGTADFCLCPPPPVLCETKIKGTVKCPTTGELVSGATIKVYNSSNAVVATKTTGATGTYEVLNLPVGTYYVKVTLPSGYNACSNTTVCTSLVCGSIKTVDFCACPPCISSVVTGVVKCSTNGQAISGVTVKVFDSSNTVKGTAITAADGSYTISGLPAGNYTVRITVPGGYKVCCGSSTSVCITLTCPQTKTVNFCICPTCPAGSVLGTIKCSSNGQPVANVTVKVYQGSTQKGSAVTGSDGKYSIPNLPAGDYTVKVTVPGGYQLCCGSSSTRCIRLDCGEAQRVDFCLCPVCQAATVTGTVKCSSTGALISGATVKIYTSGGTLVNSATTGSDGKYSFGGLNPGNYTVKVFAPSGYEVCCGANSSVCITLACGQSKSVDFCVCPVCQPATVKGTVKCSSTGALISGAAIKLYNSAGTVVGSATSGSNGAYSIGNVAPGNYTVKITPPNGYSTCGSITVCINVACGQSKTVDFCICPPCQPASVTGTVKCSTTGAAMSGISVKVLDGSNTVKGSATTGSDGKYTITGLAAGSYTVKVTLPNGYESCGSTSTCITLACGQSKCVDFCICPPCQRGSVNGTVKCSTTNQPISGLTVKAIGSNGQVAGSATTGTNGSYTIGNLPAGNYTIKVELTSAYQACSTTSSSVSLGCGQTKCVNFCVCPACTPATVTGIVKCSTNNKVVSGVTVQVLKGNNVVGSATTGSDGKYTIGGLEATTYTVRVVLASGTQQSCGSTSVSVTLTCGQCKTINWCVCKTSGGSCSRTPGYWKNHPEKWPVTSLKLGDITYNSTQLMNLLNDLPPNGGANASENRSVKVAKFLIATRFSLLTGSPNVDNIGSIASQADTWLKSYPPVSYPSGAAESTGASLQSAMDTYVNKYGCD